MPYHQIRSIILRYFTLNFFKAHAKILHKHSFQTLIEQYKWNKLVNWFPVWNWQHSIVNNKLIWCSAPCFLCLAWGWKFTWLWFYSSRPDDSGLYVTICGKDSSPTFCEEITLLVSKVIHINISAQWSCQCEENVILCPSLPELLIPLPCMTRLNY